MSPRLFSSLTRRVKSKLSSKLRWRKPVRVRGAASGSPLVLPGIMNTSVRSKLSFCRNDCPLAVATVEKILAGPGGIAPLAWCLTHKVTDPLANEEVRAYYWHHFGVAITKPTGSVHAGCIYYQCYDFWSFSQTCEFMQGVAISPDCNSQQLLEDPSAAAATEASEGTPSPVVEEEEPEAKRPDTRPSPTREESMLPEIAEGGVGDEDWSDWLSPVQANLLQDEISSLEEKLSGLTAKLQLQTSSLNISQSMIGSRASYRE